MLTMSIAEARAEFSGLLKKVQMGESVTIVNGRRRVPIAVVVPFDVEGVEMPEKRPVGLLEHWNFWMDEDYKLTEEELFGDKFQEYTQETQGKK